MNNCIDAFKSLKIINYNGSILASPCSISPVVESKIIDFKNIQYLKDIRNSWTQGNFPDPCRACKVAEAAGIGSRRLGANQWYEDNGYDNSEVELIRLDYWVGDTCNLRCAICGPENSSAWKQELNVPSKLKKSVTNYFWKTMDLTTLRWVHFNGGEPLLSKTHVEFLQALPNKDQIHINYNTNATILQRYPANWKQVTNNLQWYIDNAPHNCMFAVNTTVSILNHANLDKLNLWLTNNFYVSRFTDPIAHRQQFAIELFALDGATERIHQIKRFLESCDARRGTDWRATFPELVDYLG